MVYELEEVFKKYMCNSWVLSEKLRQATYLAYYWYCKKNKREKVPHGVRVFRINWNLEKKKKMLYIII